MPSTGPDITYCLDIFNITHTSPTLTYSRCGINQTSHQYKQPLLYCAEYPMEVVAVNRVGNSSTTSKTLISTVKGLSLQHINLVQNNLLNY